MLNIEPTSTQETAEKSMAPVNENQIEEPDNGNPVWEEISPLIWRDAIYSEEVKDGMMGQLF